MGERVWQLQHLRPIVKRQTLAACCLYLLSASGSDEIDNRLLKYSGSAGQHKVLACFGMPHCSTQSLFNNVGGFLEILFFSFFFFKRLHRSAPVPVPVVLSIRLIWLGNVCT